MKLGKKIKDAFNISLLSKLIIIVVIVVTTLFPTLFDPEHADWKKVLSNFVLSLVIMLASFIAQMIASRKRESEKDTYTVPFNNHKSKIKEIQNRSLSHIHQLYVKDMNHKALIDTIKEIFQQFEIDFKLYEADFKDVKLALKKGLIDKEQYSVVKLCRSGKINFDGYDYRDLTSTQILKNKVNRHKSQSASITASNIMSKMSFMLAFAIIWGMFVYDETSQTGVSPQAWIDLCSRLVTFGSGLWCGEINGRQIVEDDIRLFDDFFNFNSKFIQDFDLGIWKPSEEVNEDIISKLRRLQDEEEHHPNIEESTDEEVIEMTPEQYEKYMKEQKLQD